ncbi:hypothetical protein GCM10010266_69630 [Streptomyces griseomycini]|uniref:Uncharacterized protein n=1 Tax=Streptomyces griseomycini TaxID=66895 RepID=A0A7W7LZS4_9ACTN|nr:hypothetical protein [Streptomyces griseomycini]GGQ36349.1 hypothetical protein GCM10010266_69630 [Streptomyces griseomycini]GGR55348.1 hypothetical protein GCM10015536_70710 [Streptomyces griseomycini]
MEFVFECGWCGEDNYFVGKQAGFWVDKWEVPAEWMLSTSSAGTARATSSGTRVLRS